MQNKGNALLFLLAICTVLLVSTVPLHGATVKRLVDPAATPPDDNLDGTTIDLQVPPMQAKPAQGPPDRNTPLDVSSASQEIQVPATQVSVLFPATGDVVSLTSDPDWWHAGDYAEGTRTPGLSNVDAVRYDLVAPDNSLNGTGHVDFNLSINGVVVGSFTVLPGEMSKSVAFSFPPFSGPTYTIRLEETNEVDPGAGSIVIPLDTSSITLFDNATSPFFPTTGDDVRVASDPNWWHVDDYAEGTRTLGLSSVNAVSYDLIMSNNVLNGTGHVDFDLSINGAVVGSFSVLPGEMSKSVAFFFPPISGPTYTIRLQETNVVDPGAGSIIIPLDASPIRLFDSTSPFFPATGDDISVASDPNWRHAGDYAEGTRTHGLSGVHGVSYDLAILNNVLSGTAHLDFDLSINGAVVGSFAVLPGETSKSLTYSFPPISGPTYTIRLEETNDVDPEMGSIVIPLDTSPIILEPWYSVYLPLAVR
jgi:hypothetical protein